MEKVSTLGIDLAKTSFTVCGFDANGKELIRKEFKRDRFAAYVQNLDKCDLVMEACGSSHYWARKFESFGHNVKLVAPQKVVGFRKCNKNDRNDAFAIAVAGLCPGMEFVPIKSVVQQDIQSVIRIRIRLIARQTSLVNEIRGLLSEYGIIVPEGIAFIRSKISEIANTDCKEMEELTPVMKQCIQSAHDELNDISNRIESHGKLIQELTESDDRCVRLQTIPGVGPITAATIVATLVNPKLFKNGRKFAASIGLTPKHVQTGGKENKPIQLGISKHGNPVLRSLLVQGGMAVAQHCKARIKKAANTNLQPELKSQEHVSENKPQIRINNGHFPHSSPKKAKAPKKELSCTREDWMRRLITEKGMQKTAVAIANRNARIILAILKNGGSYKMSKERDRAA